MVPLKEATSSPKEIKILWNYVLEESFREIKYMVLTKTLLNYPYCKIPFAVNTDAYDKYLGSVISYNNKPIACFQVN